MAQPLRDHGQRDAAQVHRRPAGVPRVVKADPADLRRPGCIKPQVRQRARRVGLPCRGHCDVTGVDVGGTEGELLLCLPCRCAPQNGQKGKGDSASEGRTRPLYTDGAWHEAQVFARESLERGARIEGAAIIQQFDATTVIEPRAVATVDSVGNLRIRVCG